MVFNQLSDMETSLRFSTEGKLTANVPDDFDDLLPLRNTVKSYSLLNVFFLPQTMIVFTKALVPRSCTGAVGF